MSAVRLLDDDDYTYQLTDSDREFARRVAALRDAMKRQSTKQFAARPSLSANYIGVCGEIGFAKRYGLSVDDADRPGGDGGIDFTFHVKGFKYTVNVKTANKPVYLPIKTKYIDKCADLLVLYRYRDGDIVTLLGWQTKAQMARMQIRDLSGEGIESYCCPRQLLRANYQLDRFINGRDK
jgi:hypothetical protein